MWVLLDLHGSAHSQLVWISPLAWVLSSVTEGSAQGQLNNISLLVRIADGRIQRDPWKYSFLAINTVMMDGIIMSHGSCWQCRKQREHHGHRTLQFYQREWPLRGTWDQSMEPVASNPSANMSTRPSRKRPVSATINSGKLYDESIPYLMDPDFIQMMVQVYTLQSVNVQDWGPSV